ncbi:MAG: orotidine-5'-phosphate decarboxylase [Candidatus Omnitrophica bacterium]|nr:orotidine-5'-phosphate decarboxylase [Candidatus Omnitrophota bacterium]MBU4457459.1 orotidine-5'-phosphate decarboxylase [Candidatus Omnitrophota bacterium]
MDKDKIIIALDVNTIKEEQRLLDILSPHVNIFKIGMELFYSCGAKAVELVKKYDREVFLDLKFHDIPNTVKNASKAAAKLGVFMFNVHASGGSDMMKAALEGAEEESEKMGIGKPKILGVTVLTSIESSQDQVLNLARSAKESGIDGVVASAQEAKAIRKKLGEDFLIVTPGIRPKDTEKQDQKRTATPQEALQAGADYIIIGRPVTKAKDPKKVLEAMK